MSTKLFEEVHSTLRDELLRQLPCFTRQLFLAGALDGNNLYEVGLKHNLEPRDLAIIRQIRDLPKRYIGGLDKGNKQRKQRDSACSKKFLDAVKACEIQNSEFHKLDHHTMMTLDYARDDIYNVFWTMLELDDPDCKQSIFAWEFENSNSRQRPDRLIPIGGFSSGPGTVLGVQGTSVMQKYCKAEWSVTSDEGRGYIQYLRRVSKPIYDMGDFPISIANVLKATYVAKDHLISRLIAPQTNGDILLQYPAEAFLTGMLKFFGINLETQPDINREMARKGSLFDNDDIYSFGLKSRKVRFCTIDLVSASDIVGQALCRYELPPPLFDYLNMCRATSIKLDDGTIVQLPMMATMGNAYCFPLQTLIFAALVRAVYRRLGIPFSINGESTYSVFGDDIIVDITAYPYIIELLKSLHMQPNLKKSFSRGLFRESCGGDFYNGYDIRPVFCEELDTDCGIYTLANQLVDWGSRLTIDVSKTVAFLLNRVKVLLIVPPSSAEHQGFRVSEMSLNTLPNHWRATIKASVCSNRSEGIIDRNQYASYSYTMYEKGVGIDNIKSRCQSTFPFLRGGIKQHPKKQTIYQVPNKNWEFIAMSTEVIPNWDGIYEETS